MKKNRFIYVGTVAIILGLSGCGDSNSSDCGDKSVTQSMGASETEHKEVHFSYEANSETSPAHWGELKEEWATCKNGVELTAVVEGTKHQSPVDFYDAVPVDGNFTLEYNKVIDFKVKNNGHSIQFDAMSQEPASLMIGDTKYLLKQFHFHSLSEHTEKEKHSTIEGHFVNVSEDGQIAVVGVFVDENSSANSELAKAFSLEFPEENLEGESIKLNPSKILPTGEVYSYSGSLTTPPCSEDVKWNIYTTHINLDPKEVQKFTNHYDHNYRPVTGTY